MAEDGVEKGDEAHRASKRECRRTPPERSGADFVSGVVEFRMERFFQVVWYILLP